MPLIPSKEIIEKLNISYQTLNFYTNLGLFQVEKWVGNKRFYDEGIVSFRMEQIKKLKEDGYPLRLIAKKLDGESATGVERGVGVNELL